MNEITPISVYDLLHHLHQSRSFSDICTEFSPYLTHIFEQQRNWLEEIGHLTPQQALCHIIEACQKFPETTSQTECMMFLRLQKKRSVLIIALCDIMGHYPVYDITQMLSQIADSFITVAFENACYEWVKRGKLPPEACNIHENSGFFVCAMGKLGAFELNFSSDVDICVFFDNDALTKIEDYDLADAYTRVTKSAVKILSERTAHGYVYRTDLRLRPDPSSTKVAVSIDFAEHYYERSGQNWERAAWIKGRFICGDLSVWQKFQSVLRPFIWRKNLDYATIQDIQSIKRQIHAHYGHADVKVAGHDIKLGRGGIREIELFVQTQQLIGGGRDLRLRKASTFDALDALVEKQWVTLENAHILKSAYQLFRKIEHRLQMVHDSQTHLIPENDIELEKIALFADFNTVETFIEKTFHALTSVTNIYNNLFSEQSSLGTEAGSLVFTGHDDDPATLNSLKNMGFLRPEIVTSIIRKWHFGTYRAMRSAKARELLTEITPVLLEKIAKTHHPDNAIVAMDNFMAGLPTGIGFFSYMLNNPKLLDLIIDIMGSTPELAEFLARYPATFDIMTDYNFFTPPQTLEEFFQEFSYRASKTLPTERLFNILRRFTREQKFRISVAILQNRLDNIQAGRAFSLLANMVLEIISSALEQEMRTKYHLPPLEDNDKNRLHIVGMGSLGALEMNASSDLDVLMIYEGIFEFKNFSGSLPDVQTYYTKLGQRILTALTVFTEEGNLYDVDMRLRPSGRAGPLVTSLERFKNYHIAEAQTWEHLALMRAKPMIGSQDICHKIHLIIHDTLTKKRDTLKIAQDTHNMREKLLVSRKAGGLWDIKLQEGGLFDISFIIQYLGLVHANDYPDILNSSTKNVLIKLHEKNLISSEDYIFLSLAWDNYHTILQIFAVTKIKMTDLKTPSKFLLKHLYPIFHTDIIEDIENKLQDMYKKVRRVYKDIFI